MIRYGERNWEVPNEQALKYLEALRERMWNFNWLQYPHHFAETMEKIENFLPSGLLTRWVSATPRAQHPWYIQNCFTCSSQHSGPLPVPYCVECYDERWKNQSETVFAKNLETFRQVYNFCTREVEIVTPESLKLKTWAQMETEL